jgi:exopolysaccharide biosynthesis polyprenyl glycosylphosphotransferase
MLRRFSINFALLSMLLDGLSTLLGLSLAVILRPMLSSISWIKEINEPNLIPPILYIVFPIIWVTIFSALSIYDGRKFLRAADELAALFLATFIASISTAGILYFSFRDVSRALYFVFVFTTFLLTLTWRIFARIYFRRRREMLPVFKRVLIVGTGPLGQGVASQIKKSKWENLTLIGFVDDRGPTQDQTQSPGMLNEIKSIIAKHKVTDVVVALPYSAYHQMTDIVACIDNQPVGVWIALGFFDLALYRTDIEDFAGIPMLDLRASAIDDYQRLMKRAFDIFFVTFALIFTLPLMGLLALMVLLEDGSPVLFRQKRVGENGRLFEMLKFRTMVRNAEQLQDQMEKWDAKGNMVHKTKDDPRVTSIGRFLRRFSLDELPQLFNILTGTMSLVGPRPEIPYLVDRYQPWQRKRFAVPPGLTGWWQVNGRSDKPMHLHTEDDLYYIQNYSIWLDLQILVRTIWVVLIGKGSY